MTHIEAVAEFVAALTLDPAGRETGSGLYAAYCRQRGLKGWPSIPANAFGAILRPAIERVGGQKRKSNRQTYIGIRLPPV